MRSLIVGLMAVLLVASSVRAETTDSSTAPFPLRPAHDPWHIDWLPESGESAPVTPVRSLTFPTVVFRQGDAQPLHAVAIEHSDAYLTRAKIHKIASFATLPLFAAEFALGQALYNNSANAGSMRGAHGVVGAGIVGLFAVNTVTGAWNMFGEGWDDREGRTLRLVHGLLMMAADVGFLATTQSGPNSHSQRQALTFETSKVTHRNMAVASISIGTAGYLLMLLGNH